METSAVSPVLHFFMKAVFFLMLESRFRRAEGSSYERRVRLVMASASCFSLGCFHCSLVEQVGKKEVPGFCCHALRLACLRSCLVASFEDCESVEGEVRGRKGVSDDWSESRLTVWMRGVGVN